MIVLSARPLINHKTPAVAAQETDRCVPRKRCGLMEKLLNTEGSILLKAKIREGTGTWKMLAYDTMCMCAGQLGCMDCLC